MDKLNFLTDKWKQILGVAFSIVFILCFVVPQMPGLGAHKDIVSQWSGWVAQVSGLLSVFLGLQVFNPSRR